MHELFQKRHSVRDFRPAEVEQEKLNEILKAADSAPSAGGLKAREIVVVKDRESKEKLARASRGQDFIISAGALLVFFAIPSRSAQKYGERGEELYSVQDATIAASFAWLQAVALGLSACWVGAFEEEEIKEILDVDKEWKPVAILPVGYQS